MNGIYKRDIGWGIFFLLMAITIWILVPYQIPVSGKTHMGPRFFPRVISLVMAAMSLGLVASNLVKSRKRVGSDKNGTNERRTLSREDLRREIRTLLIFALMLIYGLLMPKIGFIISSIAISCIMLFVLAAKKWYYYVIMAASVLLIYYLFKYQLYVQLP